MEYLFALKQKLHFIVNLLYVRLSALHLAHLIRCFYILFLIYTKKVLDFQTLEYFLRLCFCFQQITEQWMLLLMKDKKNLESIEF